MFPASIVMKTYLDLLRSDITNADYRKDLAGILLKENAFYLAIEQTAVESYILMSKPGTDPEVAW